MNEQEYLEYWQSMSAEELIVRCGLYIKKIAEVEASNAFYQQRCRDLRAIIAAELNLLDDEIDERIAKLSKE